MNLYSYDASLFHDFHPLYNTSNHFQLFFLAQGMLYGGGHTDKIYAMTLENMAVVHIL